MSVRPGIGTRARISALVAALLRGAPVTAAAQAREIGTARGLVRRDLLALVAAGVASWSSAHGCYVLSGEGIAEPVALMGRPCRARDGVAACERVALPGERTCAPCRHAGKERSRAAQAARYAADPELMRARSREARAKRSAERRRRREAGLCPQCGQQPAVPAHRAGWCGACSRASAERRADRAVLDAVGGDLARSGADLAAARGRSKTALDS